MADAAYVPSFILYINGSRIPVEREADVKEIILDDQVNAVSTFTILVNNPDDQWLTDTAYSEGSKIQIMLGYKDALEEAFAGDILGLSLILSKNHASRVIIKGANFLHRLSRNYKINSFINMTDQDIIDQIAREADLSTEIDNLSGEHLFTLQHSQTDYQYLLYLAERYDCNLWLRNKKLFFKRLVRNSAEDLILEYGKSLKTLNLLKDTSRIITDIQVRGWNLNKHEAIIGNAGHADIDSEGGGTVNDCWGEARQIHIDYMVKDQNSADQLALDILTGNERQFITGYGACQGNPALMAGTTLQIKGIGEKFSGNYFVTNARHRFTIDTYTTDFQVIGFLASSAAAGSEQAVVQSRVVGEPPHKEPAPEKTAGSRQDESEEQAPPLFKNLKWMKEGQEIKKARVGDIVYCTADVENIPDGKWIRFRLYEQDSVGENDEFTRKQVMVKEGRIELPWTVEYHEDEDDLESLSEESEKGYTLPEYIFVFDTVQKEPVQSADSPLLEIIDWIEIKVVNQFDGTPLANEKFTLMRNGEKAYEGTLDDKGYARIDEICPGKYRIYLDEEKYKSANDQ